MSYRWQLWCYYEREDNWKMEGFFRDWNEAERHLERLRNDPETPCMPDFQYVKVEVTEP